MNSQQKVTLLNQIAEEVKNCQKCELCKTATNAVPGVGNPDTKIMIIGEAPGATEDQQGLPFVGRAGKLLDFMLAQINIKRSEIWIGNIIKHRPPNNRDPLPNEIEACKPYLTRQIEIIKPKLIVTLGRFSMNYFLPEAKISLAHGVMHTISKGQIAVATSSTQKSSNEIGSYNLFPVYHPAAALRNPNMKITLLQDFLKIPAIINKIEGTNLVSSSSLNPVSHEPDPESQVKMF